MAFETLKTWWPRAATALFMACLLHVPPVSALIAPAETVMQAWAQLVHRLTMPAPRQVPDLSAVMISPERFETHYLGRRPLPRDKLLEDIRLLMDGDPGRVLALDIDISPPPGTRSGAQAESETALDSYIAQRAGRFVLILPFPAADAANRAAKAQWMRKMCAAGVAFADPRIRSDFGVITRELEFATLSLAHLLRTRLGGEGAGHAPGASLCTRIGREPAAADLLLEPGTGDALLDELSKDAHAQCAKEHGRHGCAHAGGELLSFGNAYARISHHEWCADGAAAANPFASGYCGAQPQAATRPPARGVVLGGAYDAADRFSTPLGILTGTQVHAIASLEAPTWESHLLDIALDFLFGVGIGVIVHAFWRRWFHAKRGQAAIGFAPRRTFILGPASAWVVPVALFALLAVIAIAAMLLSALVLTNAGAWLSPVPMTIGMLIDGFVLGGVETAVHESGHSSGDAPHAPAPATPLPPLAASLREATARRLGTLRDGGIAGVPHALAQAIPWAVWLGVVAYALFSGH